MKKISDLASRYLSQPLEDAYRERFGSDLPDTLNSDHRIMIVAAHVSERIIEYLSNYHGVRINAATSQYFKRLSDGVELLARVFCLSPRKLSTVRVEKAALRDRLN